MKKKFVAIILFTTIVFSVLVVVGEDTLFNVMVYDFNIFCNGKKMKFNSPILLIDGQTYIPLRDFAEEMNHSVEWYGNTKEITLTDNSLDVEKVFKNLMFELPATADILNYAYSKNERDEHLTAVIHFEGSDLKYIQDELEKCTRLLSKEQQESNGDLLKGLKKYWWWDTSISEADYVYFAFKEGIDVTTTSVYALICKPSEGSKHYKLYLVH